MRASERRGAAAGARAPSNPRPPAALTCAACWLTGGRASWLAGGGATQRLARRPGVKSVPTIGFGRDSFPCSACRRNGTPAFDCGGGAWLVLSSRAGDQRAAPELRAGKGSAGWRRTRGKSRAEAYPALPDPGLGALTAPRARLPVFSRRRARGQREWGAGRLRQRRRSCAGRSGVYQGGCKRAMLPARGRCALARTGNLRCGWRLAAAPERLLPVGAVQLRQG